MPSSPGPQVTPGTNKVDAPYLRLQMNTTLYEILERSARAALDLQRADGAMPSGRNGPYHDPETPVRNTAHWLITFAKAHDITGAKVYRETAHRALEYVQGEEARPMGATFWHRTNPEKDTCNGLIGQAWTIEALVTAAERLGADEAVEVAEDVFLLHPYDERAALWRPVSADGTYLSFDLTFNHQLWFAAAGGLLAPYADAQVDARVRHFLDRVDTHLRTHWSGLIYHPIYPQHSLGWRARTLMWRLLRQNRTPKDKEIGYHAFNMYAFGLLREQYPQHSFWEGRSFRAAWEYMRSERYARLVEQSPYGYPYNPPGFEVAFALSAFARDTRREQAAWVSRQLERGYDFEQDLMRLDTADPATHAARLYEATRLPDLELRGLDPRQTRQHASRLPARP